MHVWYIGLNEQQLQSNCLKILYESYEPITKLNNHIITLNAPKKALLRSKQKSNNSYRKETKKLKLVFNILL